MTVGGAAGMRFLVLILVISIVISSATIYGFTASWYGKAVVTASIERNVTIRMNHFTSIMPANPNGSVVFTSEFLANNSANTDIYANVEQRIYLINFAASNLVADCYDSDTSFIPVGSTTTMVCAISVLYFLRAPLYSAANSSGNWLWVFHVTLTAESGNLSVSVCFRASLLSRPNATSSALSLPSDSCSLPTGFGIGGG